MLRHGSPEVRAVYQNKLFPNPRVSHISADFIVDFQFLFMPEAMLYKLHPSVFGHRNAFVSDLCFNDKFG